MYLFIAAGMCVCVCRLVHAVAIRIAQQVPPGLIFKYQEITQHNA